MGQATITLNGRTYRLRCGDGEETRLLALASHVRDKIDRLSVEFGQVGDDRLMVMAALLITDELFELRTRIAELQSDPSLFEPLPDMPAERVQPAAPPSPPPVIAPKATQPMLPEPEGPSESSLKRALKRPQPRQTLDERLADARDKPVAPERTPRKSGSG